MKIKYSYTVIAWSFLFFIINGCHPRKEGLNKSGNRIEFVNVFIGTDAGGNTSPAACAPFGMISCGPTNLFGAGDEYISRAGYWYSKDTIAWFSLTHVSGWGCNGALDIPFMPVTGIPQKNPIYHPAACASAFSHKQEKAAPGFYEVFLKDDRVKFSTAVSERACITNIQYPEGKQNVLVFSPPSCANGVTASQIHIDTTQNLLTGSATSGGFCSRNPALYDYTVYFAARFNRKVSAYGGWNGNKAADPAAQLSGDSVAAWLAFGTGDTVPLEMKIAISFVSVENATLNLEKETNGMDIASLKAQTTEKWNKGLSKMEAETNDSSLKIQLYTALYHNMLHPNIFEDVNGQYKGFNDSVYTINPGHHKYVTFSNWDTYRTTAQLQGLLFPSRAADMIHSLYLDAMQGDPAGFPIWGYFNNETWIMNGYSGLPLIANLYAFGGRDIDLKTIKNKMVWAADHKYSHVDDYIKYGYVPDYESNYNYSVSMTLEYAIDDFAVAQMCKYAGDSVNYHRFLKRSRGVFKLFNAQTGYLQRKDKEGKLGGAI
ncbi:MAG TPA: GH92 family glycosyl hydrolase [Bacteroidales bacterium]|nr:GH92 family glycosyl hydrolase [Bacteroidales bacterium]